MSAILSPSTADMDERQLKEFRESCRVCHSILYRPGTRLCVGTADDVRELEEVRAEQEAASSNGAGAARYSNFSAINKNVSTPQGVRPSVLLPFSYSGEDVE